MPIFPEPCRQRQKLARENTEHKIIVLHVSQYKSQHILSPSVYPPMSLLAIFSQHTFSTPINHQCMQSSFYPSQFSSSFNCSMTIPLPLQASITYSEWNLIKSSKSTQNKSCKSVNICTQEQLPASIKRVASQLY